MYVKWGSTMSSKFQVTNGVRQGGVLSPLLFDVYVNELSELLNKSGIGRKPKWNNNKSHAVCG